MFISMPVLIILIIAIVYFVGKAEENKARLDDLENDLEEKGLSDDSYFNDDIDI